MPCSSASLSGAGSGACPTLSRLGSGILLYCIILCIVFTYVFFIVFSPPLCVGNGYSFMGTSDMTRDWVSCWTVHLSLFVLHLSLAGLAPQQRVLPWVRNERHSVAWPCLPCSWTPSALLLRHSVSCLLCLCLVQAVVAFASHLTLTDT